MDPHDQSPDLRWHTTPLGAVPVATRFDDPYFSLDGGLAETGHVFHGGNDLPGRFRDGFAIAELGFGTGLNLLATVALWHGTGAEGRFRYTSFEAYPMTADQMAAALAAFPVLAEWACDLIAAVGSGKTGFALGAADVNLVLGDAGQTLPHWHSRADAWFLDGFSPARNPEMWSLDLMAAVARHTVPGGSFATYTAAGDVRRGLQAAGFQVQRVAGYGRKRHMTRGWLAMAGAQGPQLGPHLGPQPEPEPE